MTDEQRIRELLLEIVQSGRAPQDVCAKDERLLPAVLSRLARVREVEQQVDALFPSSGYVRNKSASGNSRVGHLPQVDGYEVLGILGQGGMGVVYTARHLRLKRIVALKMLLAGAYATQQEVIRFLRESQAVAGLQHANIVQVYDVGELNGRPYFTMELVDGGSLAQALAGAPQPPEKAAVLIARLADAVHFAHTKGIVHRDLKPGNILIAGDKTAKIADFGLAKSLSEDSTLTIADARIGTPSYMAPEQALGRLGSIGPSVDIYALGAILYEMLTGRPPFRADSAIETQRQVVMTDVASPSRLNANVPRDLETICLKCLHKDPARRYTTAADLAADLQRFLKGQPVLARPVSVGERTWRWAKRNRAVAASLVCVATLLLALITGSLLAAAHFRRLEHDHRELAEQKGQLLIEKDDERKKAVKAEQRESSLRHQAEEQGALARCNLYLTETSLAGQAATLPSGLGRVSELLTHWDNSQPDLRNWEWFYLHGLCHRSLSTRLVHASCVHSVAWSPDGSRMASASADRSICIWNPLENSPPLRLQGHKREVVSVAWSPSGQKVASASWDGTVRIWDAETGNEDLCFEGHSGQVFVACWHRDGGIIASSGQDQTILLWDTASGKVQNTLRGHENIVAGLAFSPDGQRLASASRDSMVKVWAVSNGSLRHSLVGHSNWANQVAWNLDGTRLASASNDQTIRIWDVEKGQELQVFRGHGLGVTSVAWHPDGTRLASCSDDKTVRVWSAEAGGEAFRLRGHTAPLATVAWNPKGDRLVSSGYDNTIKIWDATAAEETPVLASHEHPIEALVWGPRGSNVAASADGAGQIKIWDMATRTVKQTFTADTIGISSLAWHPAGTRLAAGSGNGMIRIWNIASGKEPDVLSAHVGRVYSLAWSPDGRRIASGGLDRSIRIWDAASGSLLRTIESHEHSVYTVAWSPNGQYLASASGDRTAKVWNVDSGEEITVYRRHPSEVVTLAWGPDGKEIASAGFDQCVHIWSARKGDRSNILRGHTAHIAQVVWHPDGARVATAGRDGTVKIWDAEIGREALSLSSHAGQVNAVAWSDDGLTLASAGEDKEIHLHDATPGYYAARSPDLVAVIDRKLAIDPSQTRDWRSRAEIHARHGQWSQAAADVQQYLLLSPSPSWFVADGVVAGPYPANLSQPCSPERDDFFKARTTDGDGADLTIRVSWKAVPYSDQGIINFGPLTEYADNVSAYALFPVFSPTEQQVTVLLGTDDQARLWLNGTLLYESLRSRHAVPDDDAVPAHLKTGWNYLLVRVANENGDHALCLRLAKPATPGK